MPCSCQGHQAPAKAPSLGTRFPVPKAVIHLPLTRPRDKPGSGGWLLVAELGHPRAVAGSSLGPRGQLAWDRMEWGVLNK